MSAIIQPYRFPPPGGGTPAAITLIDNEMAAFTSASSGCTTAAINTTGADLLILCVTGYTGNNFAVSDSKGNTWTARTLRYDDEDFYTRVYYCVPTSVGSGHTFTLSGTDVYGRLFAAAFSGGNSSPYDTETFTKANASANAVSSGAVTPAQDGSLLIGFLGAETGGSFDCSGGSPAFTLLDMSTYVPSQNVGGGLGYYVQSSAASIDSSWTWAAPSYGQVLASLTAFKPALV